MDKELMEKVKGIVDWQFSGVTNLTEEAYLDSLNKIAEQAIPIIGESIFQALEEAASFEDGEHIVGDAVWQALKHG